MALLATSLGSLGDTTTRSVYTCALQRAPADNALVIVAVDVSAAVGTPVQPSSVSGTGLVFSLITSSVSYDPTTGGSQTNNFSVWRSMGAGLSGSVISVALDITTQGCVVLVTEISGVSTSGTSGANAVGQSATSVSNNSTGLLIIGPSATSTANGWFTALGRATTAGISGVTANVNYISLDSVSHTVPSSGLFSAWTALSASTMQWRHNDTDQRLAGAMVELVLDNPAIVVPTPFPRRLRVPRAPTTQSGVTGLVEWARVVAQQLNQEGYISLFSGSNPNTSGFTGIPGDLLVNIGSDSTTTRLWQMGGGITSIDTNDWHPVRIA